ncbi:amidohydrolase [Povalibacter sp.]|uniref:amidohydrolase n=1 Tax=Povalibacter sp. TaxID=1962978 RepID=UPI002F42CB3B
MSSTIRQVAGVIAVLVSGAALGEVSQAQLESATARVDASVIAWRRDIHQHPELGNRETRTAALVAAHLKKLGLDVTTDIAHTGVTAVLRGGKPGPTIALRADMDALPVVEQTDVPFKSTVTTEYMGKKVGVMHACGHDAHTAILMGIAQTLASVRADLPGTVLFIFQPAEEGPPEGEEGGASMMIKEGLFAKVKPEAVFGLHVAAAIPSGVVGYRSGPFMAGADTFQIDITGRQAHGSRPWSGVDPIVIGSQIIVGLQTIVSRQVDITELPAVVTVGQFESGVRQNIIPETARMRGTIRTFDTKVREDVIERMQRTTENIATAGGGKATLTVSDHSYPIVVNDPKLVARTLPSLQRAAGKDKVVITPLQTGAEDFAFYAQQVPSFFFYVGVTPTTTDVANAPTNHSQLFYIDEPAIGIATRALLAVAVDYLQAE